MIVPYLILTSVKLKLESNAKGLKCQICQRVFLKKKKIIHFLSFFGLIFRYLFLKSVFQFISNNVVYLAVIN